MPTLDATVTKHPQISFQNAQASVRQYTGPASYATGGDLIDANDLKIGSIVDIWFTLAVNGAGTVRLLHYDGANGKIRWVVPDTGSEVANTTDLSGFQAFLFALDG
jgi:hypothetical protein